MMWVEHAQRENKLKTRIILILIFLMAIYHAGIGFMAYFMPDEFYKTTSHTGAFNQHFIRDVGAAYLTAGLGLFLAVFIRVWRLPCSLMAGLFLLLHAFIHVQEIVTGVTHRSHYQMDVLGVLVPGFIVLFAALYFAKTQKVTSS